jgi:hypothetical protein
VQEPVAEVKPKMTGGNVGIATVIYEIYSPCREPLQPGDKLYTTPPAAFVQDLQRTGCSAGTDDECTNKVCAQACPALTTPPAAQRKPLSDEEMFKIWLTVPAETKDRFAFARAIEAAHGIKENT